MTHDAPSTCGLAHCQSLSEVKQEQAMYMSPSSQVSLTMQLGSTDSSRMLPIQYNYIYVYSINMYCTYNMCIHIYIYITLYNYSVSNWAAKTLYHSNSTILMEWWWGLWGVMSLSFKVSFKGIWPLGPCSNFGVFLGSGVLKGLYFCGAMQNSLQNFAYPLLILNS